MTSRETKVLDNELLIINTPFTPTETKREDDTDTLETLLEELDARDQSCMWLMHMTKGCNGHGKCADDNTGVHCTCDEGWEGTNCETQGGKYIK